MRYKTEILTGLSCAGVLVTALEVRKAAKNEDAKLHLEIIYKDNQPVVKCTDLTKVEKAKKLGLLYLPSFLYGSATMGCILGLQMANKKEKQDIFNAYALAAGTLTQYRSVVKELIGKEDEASIRASVDEISGDYRVPEDKVLYYDSFCRVPFVATETDLVRAINEINRIYTSSGYVGVDDLYKSLKLPVPKIAYNFGWSMEIMNELGSNWVDILTVKKKAYDKSKKSINYYILVYPTEPMYNYI